MTITPEDLDLSGQKLQESFDNLEETANSIADHMVAARRLNKVYARALVAILNSPHTCQASKMLAAAALDGGL
jgi:hypothetical protein